MLGDLVVGTVPFQGQHSAPGPQQWQAPPSQLVEAGHRPREDDICSAQFLPDGRVLCAAANNLHGDPEFPYHLVQELRSPQHRFHQGDVEIWAGNRDRYPGQARAATDVDNPGAGADQLGYCCTVQNVTIPKPVCLARPDQPAGDAGPGQQLLVAARTFEGLSEHLCRGRRRCVFHVKHPLHRPTEHGTTSV